MKLTKWVETFWTPCTFIIIWSCCSPQLRGKKPNNNNNNRKHHIQTLQMDSFVLFKQIIRTLLPNNIHEETHNLKKKNQQQQQQQ